MLGSCSALPKLRKKGCRLAEAMRKAGARNHARPANAVQMPPRVLRRAHAVARRVQLLLRKWGVCEVQQERACQGRGRLLRRRQRRRMSRAHARPLFISQAVISPDLDAQF